MGILEQLEAKLGKGRVRQNISLAPYTTFKVGGPVEFYFEAKTDEDIINAIQTASNLNIPFFVFGGVSNVVVSDKGMKGLVIKNQVMYKEIAEDRSGHVILKVSSGYSMTRLAKETADEGWSGLEYHVGLPGTLGGALYMNSKWYINPGKNRQEVYVGDPLVRAGLVTRDGVFKSVPKSYFNFAYDYSILHETKEIVLWAEFKLAKISPEETKLHAQTSMDYRKQTQPMGIASSGCYFKNVKGESVGKMIDELGLKGYSIGGAQISEKHANFIVNTGNATSEDVKNLVTFIKKRVKEKYGIDLEEEVLTI
ncbi:UDP-N-acetylenolpyruvoylglucosamine reductase [Candidatus Roizmanbacteria bacterium RIFCSPLOWO2_02_FULL_37_19]|uniref:UDP-N-acetylenolpyruvoylglucosamine reductase n=1 Tax=Candidatus Roizmanbacteria bacterium RIFCSPHIGHO2_02_FULL_37_24 TaxID=1802037 RepID=A0A1F7GZM7_9BACT|nr:MAG: UDP-N-acetylenolpyruvoylglucosamine reductase [Candidatus Roizmanbacteria bacterium RIFCSPHIGHO2_01_FULL_38_41]OGK24421.1 MAG: UDP-N-acetylenolpyruvoylglucosamine reductase [Candidatus Roizmanbacteria bacterium RIFCSPHIGHO2_02_FULL_37_24]OGK32635.1 MAG: UDP-N-acetylenolpyruvoylglucosamine reductase [Candidatus Roizmanbacteria bacterium RIFCSPHIGHO2_12_FULL_37_23]OGK44799.1 MAG: UDP-N-acetylenolpyruvoylglucosamine reductase [Candidatus Roizmanbacteria bacterium RIFCSPLOWO2_01_FULL_37_57]